MLRIGRASAVAEGYDLPFCLNRVCNCLSGLHDQIEVEVRKSLMRIDAVIENLAKQRNGIRGHRAISKTGHLVSRQLSCAKRDQSQSTEGFSAAAPKTSLLDPIE
jgi:hypothetical protein